MTSSPMPKRRHYLGKGKGLFSMVILWPVTVSQQNGKGLFVRMDFSAQDQFSLPCITEQPEFMLH